MRVDGHPLAVPVGQPPLSGTKHLGLRNSQPRMGWEEKRTERDVDTALEEDAAKGCFIFKELQEELPSQPILGW